MKFTQDLKNQFTQYLRSNGSTSFTCTKAGVSKSTLVRHMESDPVFNNDVKQAVQDHMEKCIATINEVNRSEDRVEMIIGTEIHS